MTYDIVCIMAEPSHRTAAPAARIRVELAGMAGLKFVHTKLALNALRGMMTSSQRMGRILRAEHARGMRAMENTVAWTCLCSCNANGAGTICLVGLPGPVTARAGYRRATIRCFWGSRLLTRGCNTPSLGVLWLGEGCTCCSFVASCDQPAIKVRAASEKALG